MKPKVYVVATARWQPGNDVVGVLMHADGEVTATHVSSSMSFLRGDLTTTFKDRREALETRYPDGYDIETVDFEQELPAEIAEFFTYQSESTTA